MITVESMGKKFGVKIGGLIFTFTQLNYFQRNAVAQNATKLHHGQVVTDAALTCFFNIKYALKDVKGLVDEEGKPYKLKFEEDGEALTNECVDEILSIDFSDELLFTASNLAARVPTKIVNPLTQIEIEGVEIIPPSELKGALEKN